MSQWRGFLRGSLLVAFGLACAPQHAAGPSSAAVGAGTEESKSAVPVYRFVPSVRLGKQVQELDSEHVAGLQMGRARVVVGPDGSMERALAPAGEMLMGGVPVPAHLGKGFLFWTGDGLYRARTFTGPLEPIAGIQTNAIGVEFGPSSLLLFTPDGPPRAYALEPARPVPLSPHGAIEMAAADAERALAFDAAGRALATVDGGRSWKDVTAALGGAAHGIRKEGHEVGFVLGEKVGAWLQKDGGFVRRALASASGPLPERKTFQLLNNAVWAGLPLSRTHALASDEAGLWDVDLESGRATAMAKKLPYGSSCLPLSLEEKGLLICFDYSSKGESIAVVSHARSEQPKVEKVFQQKPPFAIKSDLLVVGASCSGLHVAGVACLRSPARAANQSGEWAEVNVQAALGATWQVLYWVPKATGGVAAIVIERDAIGRSPKLALIDAASGAVTPFDAALEGVAPSGFGRDMAKKFVVLENGTLRGFTMTSGLSVDAKGHVSPPTRTFKEVASAGAFALAEDEASRLWQTTDFGERWVEVARPPFEPQLPPAPAGSRFAGIGRSMNCSLVGCVLAHESGLGTWLRLGWPVDPPRARDAAPGESVSPLAPAPPRSSPVRPKLRCVASSAPSPPGRPLLTRGTARVSENIEYRDIFLEESLVKYGLRGVVRIKRPSSAEVDEDFEPLAATKAPFEVEFVSPLDPAGRAVRTKGSLGAWTRLLKGRSPDPRGKALTFRTSGGSARPVLSAAPARDGGLLFVNEAFSFWASHTGKIRPIRPGCRADSGYVDAHGTLFVACGHWSGSTALEDTEHGRTVLRLPQAERFRSESGPGMEFFAPGAQLLTQPDAVAVAPDGKLAILRIASGSEPPTVDAPAWLLSDGPPVELAPWASLEPATSPACAKGDGYRALIQTQPPWLEVEGARFLGNEPGMSAIVRWSPERVCLEALEIGLREEAAGAAKPGRRGESAPPIQVMIVARFTGKDATSAFVGTSWTASVREAAKCELVAR